MTPSTLLVVAAHPDDEVLGCGATVASRVAQGWKAHLLVLASGETSRHDVRAQASAEVTRALAELKLDLRESAKLIGFDSVSCLDLPDNRLDTVARMDVARAIDEHVERLEPELILTHHPGDYNWDHVVAFEAVLMAARATPGEWSPRELLLFEVPSSTERAWQNGGRVFQPTVYVDVAGTIEVKKRALLCYRTEARPFPHPRSAEALEALARKRGTEVGLTHAEAFELVRRIERS